MAKAPARPHLRKADTIAEHLVDFVSSRAIVPRPADRRQLDLFDEPMPAWIEPCKPRLVKTPPAGPTWLHEIKWDGYRVSAYLKDGTATVRTSGGIDWTRRFPAIAAAVEALPVRSAILDGEAIVLDKAGRSHFGDLQAALGRRRGGGTEIRLLAFDLLYFDGMDIRTWPLENRRAVLEGLICASTGSALLLSQEFDAPGYLPSTAMRGALGAIHVATELADRCIMQAPSEPALRSASAQPQSQARQACERHADHSRLAA